MPTPPSLVQYTGYCALRISVPNDGVPHQILALMQAVDPNCPVRCKYFTIQNDPLTSTVAALIGSNTTTDQGGNNAGKLSATNYGVVLSAQSSETFGGFWDDYLSISRMWVQNNGGVVNLCIQAVRG